jgi:hypothetical protein
LDGSADEIPRKKLRNPKPTDCCDGDDYFGFRQPVYLVVNKFIFHVLKMHERDAMCFPLFAGDASFFAKVKSRFEEWLENPKVS